MDLRRFEHVLALAEERHFGRAAERVHLSQPAFSRSIQAAESALDLRLFEREGGDIRPTPGGEFVIARARRLLFDARCLRREVELFRNGELGDTAFGVGPFPAATLLPSALVALRLQHPAIGLRVEVNNWRLLLQRLLAEDIEFFVSDVREMAVDAALDIRSLGRQHGGFFVRAQHPLAGRRCELEAVWAFGIASIRLPAAILGALAVLLKLPDGASPALALECDDVALLKTVGLTTDTIVATTDAAARDVIESGAMCRLNVHALPPLYAEMGVVSLRNRTLSPAAGKVIGAIEAAAERVNTPIP